MFLLHIFVFIKTFKSTTCCCPFVFHIFTSNLFEKYDILWFTSARWTREMGARGNILVPSLLPCLIYIFLRLDKVDVWWNGVCLQWIYGSYELLSS